MGQYFGEVKGISGCKSKLFSFNIDFLRLGTSEKLNELLKNVQPADLVRRNFPAGFRLLPPDTPQNEK